MRNDLEHFLDNLDEFIGIKLRDTFNIRTLGLEHPQHWGIENGRQLQEGIFQQQGNVRIFFDLFLH
jgi:hypothetical protein